MSDSRLGITRELVGYRGWLDDFDHTFLTNERRKLSSTYACAELLWYLSGHDSIEMIKAYAPQYENFAEDGVAHGAYGNRWLANWDGDGSQLDAVIKMLGKDPSTRQAVVTMWNARDDLHHAMAGDRKDIPCTIAWHFLVRHGGLSMFCYMRSNDVWLGMPYDVFVNTTVQRLIASALGLKLGVYTHNASSLHAYEKDWAKTDDALRTRELTSLRHRWPREITVNLGHQVERAVSLERSIRESKAPFDQWYRQLNGLCAPLRDAVTVCASKWVEVPDGAIGSHALKGARQC